MSRQAISHDLSGFLRIAQDRLLPAIFIVGISLILAGRVLYTLPDDENNIGAFEGHLAMARVGWLYFLEEPLWQGYTSFMGSIFLPETAFRITILISSLVFLVASSKLARGAWMFVLIMFIVDPNLSAQLFSNQLRQGFALSIFLAIVAGGGNPFWGAVVAAGIHSSFLFVIPCVLAANVTNKSAIFWASSILALAILTYFLSLLFQDIYLGRRTDTYLLHGILTIFFYVFFVVQYGTVFSMLTDNRFDERQNNWFHLCIYFAMFTLFLCYIHEAMARLVSLANSFVMILIGFSLRIKEDRVEAAATQKSWLPSIWLMLGKERARICAAFWVLSVAGLQLYEGAKKYFDDETWYGRWMLIIGS